jgi:FKBP-type peptidyl-prolyl cis-trans isomerase
LISFAVIFDKKSTMYRITIILSVFLLSITSASAQCDSCPNSKNLNADYCFTSSDYPEMCAQFSEKRGDFAVSKGKKSKDLPSQDVYDAAYFRTIARDKKLKISAEEMLFIQEAAKTWTVERRKFGHTYTQSGLGYKMITTGNGPKPEAGLPVKVHYTGYLEDGTEFDSSYKRNAPFSFTLGQGQVIKGWDEGVALLNKGSKAILRIPADLGYGAMQRGPIPANATLYFVIEVIEE